MADARAGDDPTAQHEIKTPLTSIRLMAETLQEGRAASATSPERLGPIVGDAELRS